MGDRINASDQAASRLDPPGFNPSRFISELERRRDRAARLDKENFVAPIVRGILDEIIASAKAALEHDGGDFAN